MSVVQGSVGSGVHRKLILGPGVQKHSENRYHHFILLNIFLISTILVNRRDNNVLILCARTQNLQI